MTDFPKFSFSQWPADLLIDYALKIHHRGIRRQGPVIQQLISDVLMENLVLDEVQQLFSESLSDLEMHLRKEERVLFPHLYDMYRAHIEGRPMPPMHCGSVESPIAVMMGDHAAELERHDRIATLLNDYNTPPLCSDDYQQLMRKLSNFRTALQEHIHIENDIIFPYFTELEKEEVII